MSVQVNYKSDFSLTVGAVQIDKAPVELAGCEFRLEFSTAKYSSVYVAEHRGGEYRNCAPTADGGVRVMFDNHHLAPGALKCKLTLYVQDKSFPDGNRVVTKDIETGCEVVRGESDVDVTATATVQLPVLKGEKGETGDTGDRGTLNRRSGRRITAMRRSARRGRRSVFAKAHTKEQKINPRGRLDGSGIFGNFVEI